MLRVRRGLLLQDVIKPLCEQRGLPLCNVDAYVRGTDKVLGARRAEVDRMLNNIYFCNSYLEQSLKMVFLPTQVSSSRQRWDTC